VRDAIATALQQLAAEHAVRILHACESGSRAWGFASPDSDYDVRFLYAHDLAWYLRVRDARDTIECMLPGDLDLSGWELRKALRLFAKSNAALFEHLGSGIVYVEGSLAGRLRALVPEFFDPIAVANHYLGTARTMLTDHVDSAQPNLKKVFYVLRPLAALTWIEQRCTMPPTAFEAVLAGIDLPPERRRWIDELRGIKVGVSERADVALDPHARAWLRAWFDHGAAIVGTLPSRRGPTAALDALLADVVLNGR
jgi:predicted nucleotidyltransferase